MLFKHLNNFLKALIAFLCSLALDLLSNLDPALLHGKRHLRLPDGTDVVYMLGTHASPVRLGTDTNGRSEYSLDMRGEVINATSERPGPGS